MTMTYRTTFALDSLAMQRLKTLSARWHISQAEVIRRALEKLEQEPGPAETDLVRELAAYHAQGGLDSSVAEACIAEINEDRKTWRE